MGDTFDTIGDHFGVLHIVCRGVDDAGHQDLVIGEWAGGAMVEKLLFVGMAGIGEWLNNAAHVRPQDGRQDIGQGHVQVVNKHAGAPPRGGC